MGDIVNNLTYYVFYHRNLKKQIRQANAEFKEAHPEKSFVAIDTIDDKALKFLPTTMQPGETKLAIVGKGKQHRTLLHAYKSPKGDFSSYRIDSSTVLTVGPSGKLNFHIEPSIDSHDHKFELHSQEKIVATHVKLAIQQCAGPCGNLSLEGAKYIQAHPQILDRIHQRQLGSPLPEDQGKTFPANHDDLLGEFYTRYIGLTPHQSMTRKRYIPEVRARFFSRDFLDKNWPAIEEKLNNPEAAKELYRIRDENMKKIRATRKKSSS